MNLYIFILKLYPRLKSGDEYDPELVKEYMQNR